MAQSVVLTSSVAGTASGTLSGVLGEIIGIKAVLGTGMLTPSLTVTCDTTAKALDGVTVSANTYYKPRVGATTNDGSTAITNSYIPYFNMGSDMTVAITGGVSTKTITVTVYYR